MRCRGCALVVVAAVSVGLAQAAEIQYVGGGVAGDLADSANWAGGAVPVEGDVGVVDVASRGLAYSVSTNAFIGGLKFTGGTDVVVLESDKTLTLGSGGVTVGTDKGITFKLPLATAAVQTWDFGKGPAKFYKTISGTADLTLTNAKGLWHYWSPRYDGKLIYTAISEWNNSGWSKPTQINFYEPNVKWADSISASCAIRFLFNGPVALPTLFPGMSPLALGAAKFGCEYVNDEGAAGGAGNPVLTFSAGEDVSMGEFLVGGGPVYQNGGKLNVSGFFYIGNRWYYDYNYTQTCLYYLDDGDVTVGTLDIGEYGKGVTRLVQTGGKMTVTGSMTIGGGNQTTIDNLAEYKIAGGSLSVNAATSERNDGGAILYYPNDQNGYGRALLEMSDGTFTTERLMFGINASRWSKPPFATSNGSSMPCHSAYALFEMTGGVLNLGKGGIVTGANWNPEGWVGGTTNSFADTRLIGGKVVSTATSGSTAPIRLPSAGGELEWESKPGTTASVFAPVFGEGKLVKTGAGSLALTDAADFKGSVEVREGVLRLLGSSSVASADCWQWTADDLVAAGRTNLEPIATWTDSRHGVAATNAVFHQSTRGDCAYVCPKLTHNDFNGHAALKFDSSMLIIPPDVNPLVDAEELTIVMVYKMDINGTASLTDGKFYVNDTHMLNGSYGYYNNAWAPWFNWVAGDRLQLTVDSGADGAVTESHRVTSAAGVSLKGEVHVSIGSVSKAAGISLMTDGAVTNRVWEGQYRTLFHHKSNGSTITLPLVIGAVFSDSDNCRKTSGMHLAELRLYRKALPLAEQSALSMELVEKYTGYVSSVAGCVNGMQGAVPSELTVPEKPGRDDPPGLMQCWQADSLAATLGDGDAVTSWATTNGVSELTVPENFAAPTLALGAANGHAAVRFNADNRTVLSAPAKPTLTISDWNNWTVAVVFRTSQGSTGRTGVCDGNGIISITKDTTSINSFQLAMTTNGELKAYSTSKCIYQRRPLHLDDGNVHVAVFTSDMRLKYNGNQVDLFVVDGIVNQFDPGTNPELAKGDDFRLNLGRIVNGSGLFTGDIMEVRWYNRHGQTLTLDETEAVCAELADKYGVHLYNKRTFGVGRVEMSGLGAMNVTVAAGAKLALPLAKVAPYTVADGRVLDLKGDVEGTLALADGATLKLSAYGENAVSIDEVEVSGTVTLDLANLPNLDRNRKLPLFRTKSLKLAEGANIVIPNVGRNSVVEFDEANGKAILHSTFGLLVIMK